MKKWAATTATAITVASVAAQTSPSVPLPPPPQLNGRHLRITALEEGDLLNVVEPSEVPEDGHKGTVVTSGGLSFSGFLIDMIDALATRANFTYDLLTPSGLGADCEPQLESQEDDRLYSTRYRSQYNCGTNDVNDLGVTSAFLGMFYISPSRQLRNFFTIPFVPPHKGTLMLFSVAKR